MIIHVFNPVLPSANVQSSMCVALQAQTFMRTAASKGDAEVVEMLVKAKANINERDGKVNTFAALPLYFPFIYFDCVAVFVVVLCFARARHLFLSLVLALVVIVCC